MGMGMGVGGFGSSFGGGISSSGLEMFGQRKPQSTGMLTSAAQQAFQQATVKTSKPQSKKVFLYWLNILVLNLRVLYLYSLTSDVVIENL